ncbi:hypothetical protein [Bacillus infantis]|uniref:hypothetical protein n=1 Tax=Bacillus infantis TaxID=324767 RepID=UPI00301B588F
MPLHLPIAECAAALLIVVMLQRYLFYAWFTGKKGGARCQEVNGSFVHDGNVMIRLYFISYILF